MVSHSLSDRPRREIISAISNDIFSLSFPLGRRLITVEVYRSLFHFLLYCSIFFSPPPCKSCCGEMGWVGHMEHEGLFPIFHVDWRRERRRTASCDVVCEAVEETFYSEGKFDSPVCVLLLTRRSSASFFLSLLFIADFSRLCLFARHTDWTRSEKVLKWRWHLVIILVSQV